MTQTLDVSPSIEQLIQGAIAQARATCESTGTVSNECAVAWDIVEELQAERSHQQSGKPGNAFQRYCEENPDALECRIYDV